MKKILAVDLAFTVTGWVIIQDEELLAWGEIKTPRRGVRKGEKEEVVAWDMRRSGLLGSKLREIILEHKPDVIAIEVPDWHQRLAPGNWQKMYKRERQAQEKLGMAKGIALLVISQLGIEPFYAEATQVKKYWQAKRKNVIAGMVTLRYPDLVGASDHVTDAASIAVYTESKLTERMIQETAIW